MGSLRHWVAAGVCAALVGCGQPNTKGLQGETEVSVTAVKSGGEVTLSDGRSLYLIGVEAPKGQDDPFSKAARDTLEGLLLNRPTRIAHEGRAEYSEGRALGHVFVQTEGGRWIWAQEALVLEGLARVRTRKDGAERAATLLAAEAVAREARRGLWAEKSYAVLDAARQLERLTKVALACSTQSACSRARRSESAEKSSAPEGLVKRTASRAPATDAAACQQARQECATGGFFIIEGAVARVFVRKANNAVYLDFGEDYKTDFSVYVAPDDAAAWPGGVEALTALKGKRVRVRGLLDSRNGPSIRVDHAAQIEVL